MARRIPLVNDFAAILVFVSQFIHERKPNNRTILIPTSIFLLWIRFQTVYTIKGVILKYQSGPIRGEVFIKDIYKIQRTTNDPFNSGNLSGDKISIRAKNRGSINISPINKNEFIEALLMINPEIEVV
jgi:hypothetical protein